MRHLILLSGAAALAACSTQPDNLSAANSAAVAQLNEMDVQANADAPADPVVNETPGMTANVVDTPAADASFTPKVGDESPAAALAVATQYYAWIAAKDFGHAYKLWGHGGSDSNQSRAAFAQGLAKYTSYVGTTGTPGDVDPGAGQRYITIPVKVAAAKADGSKLSASGNMVLHMTGAVDGATAEQRSWHIQSIQLTPAI